MRIFSSIGTASFGALAIANPLIPVVSSRDTSIPQSSSVVPSYTVLNSYCLSAGPNAYVGVQYDNDVITSYNFGECYPYVVNGSTALAAVFCKSVICTNCSGDDCTDPNIVLTVPRSLILVNPAGVVTTVLGKGAICQELPLDLPV
ncbi:uncharacterized protein EAF01_010806 [Botrytis porri]|uniref:Uncharacterized protein n=1 Tax=Botrytis porri TaxID=87229 RepID=A0A4Z1K8U3_9HELO|nr:uncharacterized protein EAF01_010806 [Botrytis porri]KAF7889313.1 hypothetical protein EAF01_010806 [Botrytis porri]TGO81868.1 hypothetical protein BPOR_0991g00020 [Botrytis porri]